MNKVTLLTRYQSTTYIKIMFLSQREILILRQHNPNVCQVLIHHRQFKKVWLIVLKFLFARRLRYTLRASSVSLHEKRFSSGLPNLIDSGFPEVYLPKSLEIHITKTKLEREGGVYRKRWDIYLSKIEISFDNILTSFS